MARLGLEKTVVDADARARAIAHFREAGIRLPTFAQLANPSTMPESIKTALADVDPDTPDPLNLFRVHWYNGDDRRSVVDVPAYLTLPEALTGVKATIAVALGNRFPLIHAHKVLAAYACLAPRVITGQFDTKTDRAVWPSTGNYCRGGVAISRILGCHGVAVLPAGMSKERFDWLEAWAADPAEDIIRTVGTESNVKEIYDKCNELDATEDNVIFNQFSEYGNHLAHYACTGAALSTIFEDIKSKGLGTDLAAFTSATGSAGTVAAGDYLKDHHGAKVVSVEALECPTLLHNGFGEHNIQGIGDKHLPLIHNITNSDAVCGISDVDTDSAYALFNTEAGSRYLIERIGLEPELVEQLKQLGFSGICNVLAAIKTARYFDLGEGDVIVTIGTDHGAMYRSELEKILPRFGDDFDMVNAGEVFGRVFWGGDIAHYRELTKAEADRIFNLGYFTWVEQQGISVEDFEARRKQSYWRNLRELLPIWDRMIEAFNAEVAAG